MIDKFEIKYKQQEENKMRKLKMLMAKQNANKQVNNTLNYL